MSKRKPYHNPTPLQHLKRFEVFQGHMVYEQMVSENKKEAAKKAREIRQAEEQASVEARRLARTQGELTAKNLRTARELARQKTDLAQQPQAKTYYRDDIRVTPITDTTNNVYKRLTKITGLTHEEARTLMTNLDKFPNIRFEYDIWTETTKVVWDD